MAPKKTDEADLDFVNALKRALDPQPKRGDRKSHRATLGRLAEVLEPAVGFERVVWLLELAQILADLDYGIRARLVTPAPVQNKSIESLKWQGPLNAVLAMECHVRYGVKPRTEVIKTFAETREVKALVSAWSVKKRDPKDPKVVLATWWNQLKYKQKNKFVRGRFDYELRKIKEQPRGHDFLLALADAYIMLIPEWAPPSP